MTLFILDNRLFFPATKRNSDCIGDVLSKIIKRDDSILESKILPSKSEIHIISVDSDIFFLPDEDRMTTQRLKKQKVKIKNHVIESIHGHDAFLIETKQISDIFTKILK